MKSYFYIVGVLSITAFASCFFMFVVPGQKPQRLTHFYKYSSTQPTASASTVVPETKSIELYKFATQFKTQTQDDRVHNIELGASKLNKTIIKPGETISFNQVVGPRSEEFGFKNAPALFLGEVTQELGGGMCQVSSTLHAAALNAGMEIIERHPHSRPSSYITKGFDATVNYPPECQKDKPDLRICFDLKIRNPYTFEVQITTKSFEPERPPDSIELNLKRTLEVSLWGVGPIAEVKTSWKTYETPPFTQKVRKHPWRKTGKWIKQSGVNGVNGALVIDTSWPDGHKDHRTVISNYDPVNEIWEVGQDWDLENKPWE